MHFSECNILLKYNFNFFNAPGFFQRTANNALVLTVYKMHFLHYFLKLSSYHKIISVCILKYFVIRKKYIDIL